MFQGGTDDGSADDDVNLHIRSGGGGGGGGGAVAPAVTPQFGRGAATSVASGAARDASNYNRPLLSGSGASSSSHRSFVIGATIFAIVVGAGLLIYFFVFFSPSPDQPTPPAQTFGFQNIFDSKLRPKFAGVTFHPYDLSASDDSDPHRAAQSLAHSYTEFNATQSLPADLLLVTIDLNTTLATRRVLVPGTALSAIGAFTSYVVSFDASYVLFATQHQKLYRWSSYDVYRVWNVTGQFWLPLSTIGGGRPCRLAEWSPASHHIAFVLDNNIGLIDVDAVEPITTNVTSDGLINSVINGVNDWVAEEEVWSATSAIFWSPAGQEFAFLRYAEGNVRTYEFPVYDMPYNRDFVYKYPKAGFDNSVVTLGIYSLTTNRTSWADFGATHSGDYIVEVDYFNLTNLVVRTIPRLQNSFQVFAVDTHTGVTTPLNHWSSDYYLDPIRQLRYIPLPPASSNGGVPVPAAQWAPNGFYIDILTYQNYNHLALLDARTGQVITFMTDGPYTVLSIDGVNERTNTIYITTTRTVGPLARRLYAVLIEAVFTTQALTPNSFHKYPLLPREAPIPFDRTWQTTAMSSDAELLVINEQSDSPGSTLYSIGADGISLQRIAVLMDNTPFTTAIGQYALPTQHFFTFPSTVPNMPPINAYMLLPPGFDQDLLGPTGDVACGDGAKRYPVLTYVYGGPGSQQVTNTIVIGSGSNNGWHTYLASTHGMIVFVMDGIGTATAMGDAWQKNATYRQLGVNEARDVGIAGLSFLQSKCWVDANRIALWGWSYGGYLTSMTIGMGQPIVPYFRTAIAVAPVTDWRLYDSIYTERYMRTPALNDNVWGYNVSSVLQRIDGFKQSTTDFLLIHGSADDNVHYQNSALFINALVSANVQFSTMWYPNRDHSLTDPKTGATNQHLYRLLTDHLLRAMDLTDFV